MNATETKQPGSGEARTGEAAEAAATGQLGPAEGYSSEAEDRALALVLTLLLVD